MCPTRTARLCLSLRPEHALRSRAVAGKCAVNRLDASAEAVQVVPKGHQCRLGGIAGGGGTGYESSGLCNASEADDDRGAFDAGPLQFSLEGRRDAKGFAGIFDT